ncbi:MAG: futalosine hydrolase [Taibaiella sp.]|nr:futalosine hydrolase [Taibaiella sp.]
MKLLVVAATEAEVSIYKDQAPANADLLITGVGMTATTYALTKHLQTHKYDLVLQAGVGGSFDTSVPLGSLVVITAERYGDLGAEDHHEYIDIFDMGLISGDSHPHAGRILANPFSDIHEDIDLPRATGLTVNTVSGNENTIARRRQYGCTVESMEGAAFHYVCLMEGVTFAQVRSISNYVTPRDKSQWKMKDAIINLNNWLISFSQSFASK